MKANRKGFTIVEMTLVFAIIAIVITAFVQYFGNSIPFYHRQQVRQTMMVDSRRCMDTLLMLLRNGKGRTVSISTPATVPMIPNSRVDFVLQTPLPSGATSYAIYLQNGGIYTLPYPPGGLTGQLVVPNVTSLMFTSNSNDPSVIAVSLRMDAPYDAQGDTTTLFLANQTVQMVETP